MNVVEHDELIKSCKGCDLCRKGCAFLEREGNPAEVLADRDKAAKLPDECNLCGRCESLCPPGLEIVEALRKHRDHLYLCGEHSGWSTLGGRLYQWLGTRRPFKLHLPPEGSGVALFPGCNLTGTRPETFMRLWDELERVSPGLGLVQDCCMVLYRDNGAHKGFTKAVKRLNDSLKTMGVTTLLSACPSCTNALELALDGVEVRSVYELLAEPVPGSGEGNDAYRLHDSCSARDDHHLHKTVRRMLVKTGQRVEPHALERDRTFCCLHADFHGQGEGEGKDGAPYATYCAGCLQTLRSKKVKARHLLDIWFGLPDKKGAVGMVGNFVNRLKAIRSIARRANK